jgi:hypothetical protein
MMLGGKTNASAKKDGFISPDVAKPMSNLRNLCNLRIFPTPRPRSFEIHLLPFSSSAVICVHLRFEWFCFFCPFFGTAG